MEATATNLLPPPLRQWRRDWDVGGGAWWRARGTNKRQRARAILHLRFGSVRALGF